MQPRLEATHNFKSKLCAAIRMANDLSIEFDVFVFAQLWAVLAAQVLQS